jgi:hypothetical protein
LDNSVIIHSLINQNNFSLLIDLGIIEKFTNKLSSFIEKQSGTLTSDELNVINSVLENVYESKNYFMLDNHDILSASSKSSGMFKEARKLLEGL